MNQSGKHHGTLMKQQGHSVTIQSHQTDKGTEKMTYDEQKPDLDPATILLSLGYATSLIVAIGWIATLVL
ncbi:MAG: hypothetical protein KJO95_00755 [Gammaproteobacteria bacterium]|nr:hypothetical protein [Gammaproteobacteria bacterium]MBU2678589.1 hypothetical protein [Gammaproteobacteria bacterium]NNC57555.1 hypothetical protein [Woeseiaceae bacterium]NNL52323.1 hypothetical protein [Woeseiaceae bacterium]